MCTKHLFVCTKHLESFFVSFCLLLVTHNSFVRFIAAPFIFFFLDNRLTESNKSIILHNVIEDS